MDKRGSRIYAGLMAAVMLLCACGSSGGGTQTTAPAEVQTTEAQAETTAVSAAGTAGAEEKTTAAAKETGAAQNAGGTAGAETAGSAQETSGASGEASGGLQDVYEKITDQVELNSPMIVPDDFITNYFGIDVGQLEEYLFVMSEMATSAETIVIVKADGQNEQSVIGSLQTVLDQKAAEMKDYLPDQFDIVSRSEVKELGGYVYLVISENAEAIEEIIEAELQ